MYYPGPARRGSLETNLVWFEGVSFVNENQALKRVLAIHVSGKIIQL